MKRIDQIRELLGENPKLTLYDIADELGLAEKTVNYHLKKNNTTLNKIRGRPAHHHYGEEQDWESIVKLVTEYPYKTLPWYAMRLRIKVHHLRYRMTMSPYGDIRTFRREVLGIKSR